MSRLTPLGSRVKQACIQRVPIASEVKYGQGRGGRPWRRLVAAVKRRDQYTCKGCGKVTEQGACDHRIPKAHGGSDDLSNLQWLCDDGPDSCHAIKTRREQRGEPVPGGA